MPSIAASERDESPRPDGLRVSGIVPPPFDTGRHVACLTFRRETDVEEVVMGKVKDDPRQTHQPSMPTPRTEPDPDAEEGRREPPDPRPAQRQDE